MNLASLLREGTKDKHDQAESAGFVRCFMKGVLEKKTYVRHLEDFYFIYQAMEEELAKHAQHPVLSKIYFPELNREKPIALDLEFFLGANWKNQIQLSPAGKEYVDHIRKVSQENPILLVAHSYVRYLGDLSGGQILKKIAAKALNLEPPYGIQFYEFPAIENINEFKKKYRESLDTLPLTEEQKQEILNEARHVFDLNRKVFMELEEDLIANIGRDRFEEVLKAS